MSFDLNAFVADCRAARQWDDGPERIGELVRGAIARSDELVSAISARKADQPASGSMAEILLNDDDLTIYQLSFPPYLWGVPHDHATWAVIGVYAGTETFNIYEASDGRLVPIGRQFVSAGEVALLPSDLIHDIENSTPLSSGSIHVYGNLHFAHPCRRVWRNQSELAERFSPEKALEYGLALTRHHRERLTSDLHARSK